MNRGLIIDFKSVAAYLASEDAQIQADFFNVFSKELSAICQTHHHAQLQLANVNGLLDEATRENLSMLTYKEKV